jgi:hypothetical protein
LIDNKIKELERIKGILQDKLNAANKASAKQDYILSELKETYGLSSIEETLEFLNQIIEERDIKNKTIEEKYQNLLVDMKKDGFIN